MKNEGLINSDLFFAELEKSDLNKGVDKAVIKEEFGNNNGEQIRYERAISQFYYLKDTHEWLYSSIKNKL